MKVPEEFRVAPPGPFRSFRGETFGAFQVPGHKAPGRRTLNIIACDGLETGGWEHVSVSINGSLRTASWEEMCFIKNLFWDESECVVQFHPAKSDYINNHPGVLHLWKQTGTVFPMPPKECV